jgi:phosphomevalonate kinase
LQILLADVQGGTESPGMAKTVLNWKQSQRPPIPHWDELKSLNNKVVSLFHALSSAASDDTASVDYDALAALPASQWPADLAITQLAQTLSEIRTHLRAMGEAAGAPIEPPPQTKLCDATSQLPGVVTCLVPGAGGYDAVACLYIDRPSVRNAITNLWSSWESPLICPLPVQASSEGLRLEPGPPTTTTTSTS